MGRVAVKGIKREEQAKIEDITEESMLEFYRQLDVIELKYGIGREIFDYEKYVDCYAEIESVEDSFQLSELTKVEYGDILTNLDMIYSDKEKSDEIIELFDLIRSKIISKYINIEGLERLFSEKYIDFEWELHLGIDYKAHKMKYYRDHFIHQIRNAYCMHVLLDEHKFNWISYVVKILENAEQSKISKYVKKCVAQQWETGYYESLKKYVKDEEFYYKNIIYMSCYMAALFHDIGYPEVMNAANQNRIIEYISNLYNAESSGYNYSRLRALLQNSLLFRVVPYEEIHERISGEKIDHGALSAIIFLLNFYENGAIQGLMPYKKCAVELAALAIYNHTNEYRYENDITEGQYIRNQFSLNPISYLLRICDDIQEWGRIYFELSNCSNIIICSTCQTPIVRRNKDGMVYYNCNCSYIENGKKACFVPMFDYKKNFPYRRIYNVTVCECLRISYSGDMLCFDLEYNLDRLLHIAYINPDYAKYRIKELNKLKRHLEYQPDLPVMRLKYFVTANPVLIKVKILEQYLKKIFSSELNEEAQVYEAMCNISERASAEQERQKNDFWNKLNQLKQKYFNKIDARIKEIYSSDVRLACVTKSVEISVSVYVSCVIFMELYKRANQDEHNMKCREFLDREAFGYIERETKKLAGTVPRDFEELLADCFQQFGRMYLDISNLRIAPKAYFEQFTTKEYTYGCIRRFLLADCYEPVCGRKNNMIDAYTDLSLFYNILKVII